MVTRKIFGIETEVQNDGQVKLCHVLSAFSKKQLKFIQVGANDGITNDNIHEQIKKYEWTGILIEPIASAFNKLVQNYADTKNLFFENVAIYSERTVQLYYHPKRTAVSSIIKNHTPLSSMKGIQTVTVKSMTLDDIVEKHHFFDFDLLQIDAEGYDFEVIKLLSIEKYTPSIIHYEHRHLSDDEKRKSWKYLTDKGYSIYLNRNNTIGVLFQDHDI